MSPIPRRRLRLIALVVLISVGALGCGDDANEDATRGAEEGSSGDSSAPAPEETGSEAEAAAPEAADGDAAEPTTTTSGAAAQDETDPETEEVPTPPAAVPARLELPDSVAGLEGIAVDAETQRIIVGDLSNGDLWTTTIGVNSWEPLRRGSDDDRASAIGLAVDNAARRLFVATGDQGRLDIVDLGSGEAVGSIALPSVPGSLINDVTVAPDGTVYVSDSGAPRLYVVEAGGTEASLFLDYAGSELIDAETPGLQGNGIVADDGVVLFAHMASGNLMRVDRTSAEMSPVEITGDTTLGRDGLALCGDTIVGVDVAVFNGGEEALRVAELSADRSAATVVDRLPTDELSSAATIAVAGDQVIVVNAQFGEPVPSIPFWLSALPSPCP